MRSKMFIFVLVIFFVKFYTPQLNTNPSHSAPVALPLSPEAYSHLKFDINPVNLNTGVPDIREVLYTFDVDRNIKLEVDIKYHTSGLRIKEISGLVGQGWNTFNPGIITREINGLPDDKAIYGILNNGYIPSVSANGYSHSETIKYLYDAKFGREDVEFDLFHFNFLNHSGRFKLNRSGYTEYIGTTGNYKIQFDRDSDLQGGRITSFIITDDKGYRYKFDKKNTGSHTISRQLMYEQACMPMAPLIETLIPPPYTAWYMTEIINPYNTVIAQFYYDAFTEVPPDTIVKTINLRISNLPIEDAKTLNENLTDDCGTPGILFCNHRNVLPGSEITTIQNTAGLALTKINVPLKGSVEYTINNNRIELVQIKDYKNDLLKKIGFNYLNTSGGRYFLTNVSVKDANNYQLYQYFFEYISPAGLPGINTENSDFWGYHNGKPDTDLFIQGKNFIADNKRADKEFVKTGVLSKITLPTGGYKMFEFESNTYSKELSNSDLIFDIEENRDYTSFFQSKTIHNNTQIPNNLIYVENFQNITANLTATLYQRQEDIPAVVAILTPIKLTPLNPTSISQAEIDNAPEENYNNTIMPRPKIALRIQNGSSIHHSFYSSGYYKVSYIVNAGGIIQWYPVTYSLNVSYYNLLNTHQYLYGGGLRIKNISMSDGVTAYSKDYHYDEPIETTTGGMPPLISNRSSGEIVNTPIFTKLHQFNWSKVIGKNFIDWMIVPVTEQYNSATSLGYSSANAIKGAYVNYKYVRVVDDKGTIQNTFSVYSDYPDISFSSIFHPTYNFKNQDYKIGILLNDKVYDINNTLLKQTDYEYDIRDFSKNLMNKVVDINGGCYLQNGPYSYRISSYDSYINSLNSQPYPSSDCGNHPLTHISILNSEEKYGFGSARKVKEIHRFGSAQIENSTSKIYNTRFYTTESTMKLPSGEETITTYRYAHEKGISKLITANMISTPVETTVIKKKDSLDAGKTLSKTETLYDNPTHLFPTSVRTFNIQAPTGNHTEVTFDAYDAKGNLLQYTSNGITTVIIWGYNSTQPIAKIEGALYDQIKTDALITAIITASNTDASAGTEVSEQTLITNLDTLRKSANFSSYYITTYTYDPLVGVRSITPSSGIREVYLYDAAHRLKEIREQTDTGKLLKEYRYNYKN